MSGLWAPDSAGRTSARAVTPSFFAWAPIRAGPTTYPGQVAFALGVGSDTRGANSNG